jgi:alpha-L-arabinofuranosidase
MKTFTLLLSLFLVGCSTTVPVVAKFPEAPKSITEKCAPLKKLEGNQISIVELHTKVVENYTQYHECSLKVEEWNTWYTKQKKIFEEIK